MKKIQSTTEGTWIELVPVTLTTEEQELLSSRKKEDKEAKAALHAELKAKREQPLSEEESEVAQAIYLGLKPELKETDVYQLIAVNMSLEGTTGKGIINCRINGEHKQIRF